MRNDSVDRQYKNNAKTRDLVARVQDLREWDGWLTDEKTWQIVDSKTIRCADATADALTYMGRYRPCSINDGTAVRYFYSLAATNDGTNTTVTLVPHNNGASAGNPLTTGGTVSAFRYSHLDSPKLFPHWFDWTPSAYTGFSTIPPTVIHRYRIQSHTFFFMVEHLGASVSNATTYAIEIPTGLAALTLTNYAPGGPNHLTTDAGSILTTNGRWSAASAGTTISFFRDFNSPSVWTGSGQKLIRSQGFFELAAA